jgi:hypothetical protein
MVNVFTHKRYLGNRKVIYEPEEFFKTTVVESVREGLYEFSNEAKATIAYEGVTRLEKDSITTKYGDMKLEDISWLSKMLIVMEFMHDMCYSEVLNVTHTGQHLESLLKQAEKYGIDVFMSFQFCSESWKDINVAVRFNGDLMEHRMGDMVVNIACDFAPCNGIESETRLQFKGTNSEYDLFIPTSRLTLTVDSTFQMKKFMDDLKYAVENGNIKATGTKADSYADFDISPQQILIATKDNVDYIVQKLRSSNQGHIVIYKYCESVYSALRGNENETLPIINEIALKTADEKAYCIQNWLVEKEIPACGDEPAKFRFTIRETNDVIIRREDLNFEQLDFKGWE